jgi:hypothetical protein
MRARIARGEAVAAALALARGDFEGGPPSATVELSNHGVYDVPADVAEVALGQRFEG